MMGIGDLNVSRETQRLLEIYSEKLKKWNPVINLVSKDSIEHIVERHIADSLQVARTLPSSINHWADLGSGGGFPGLVVAIEAVTTGSPASMTLIESDKRKAVFLGEVVRELGLHVTIIAARIEDVLPVEADVVSARALAPLGQLCGYAHRHLKSDGTAVFLKGAGYLAEMNAARKSWTFSCDTYPSKTAVDARLLVLKDIRHA